MVRGAALRSSGSISTLLEMQGHPAIKVTVDVPGNPPFQALLTWGYTHKLDESSLANVVEKSLEQALDVAKTIHDKRRLPRVA